MADLAQEKFIPIKNHPSPLNDEEIKAYLKDVPGWTVQDVAGVPQLTRTFKFENFAQALEFTNAVGEIAEEQNHHPLIELTWGRVTVTWWTHDFDGLHKNDFIMAAKTSQRYQK